MSSYLQLKFTPCVLLVLVHYVHSQLPIPTRIEATVTCYNGEYIKDPVNPHDDTWWFQLDLLETQNVTFANCNSDFDTIMQVYNTSMDRISDPYCDGDHGPFDDCGPCKPLHEEYTIPNMAPGTYYIYIRHVYFQGPEASTNGSLSFQTYGCISDSPTKTPTTSPSNNPSQSPSKYPTIAPTIASLSPSNSPSPSPTNMPTSTPTTGAPTSVTSNPSKTPTNEPTTGYPTSTPTFNPTFEPTLEPITSAPTRETISPTLDPSTMQPTSLPTSPKMDDGKDRSETLNILGLNRYVFYSICGSLVICCCIIIIIFCYDKRLHSKKNELNSLRKKNELEMHGRTTKLKKLSSNEPSSDIENIGQKQKMKLSGLMIASQSGFSSDNDVIYENDMMITDVNSEDVIGLDVVDWKCLNCEKMNDKTHVICGGCFTEKEKVVPKEMLHIPLQNNMNNNIKKNNNGNVVGSDFDDESDSEELEQIQATIQIQQQMWIQKQIEMQQKKKKEEQLIQESKLNQPGDLLGSLPAPPCEVEFHGGHTARMSADPNGVPALLDVDEQSEIDVYHEGIDIDDNDNNNNNVPGAQRQSNNGNIYPSGENN